MISNDAFQISNYIVGLSEEYKINSEEIVNDNLEILFDEEEMKDKIITNSKIKDDCIIMTSVKIKNIIDYENQNVKDISLTGFVITVVKFDLKKGISKNQKIDINIQIKGEKTISKKNFFSQNYYFLDFISDNDAKKFLILYIFDQLHVFKLYTKDDKLKYNKIKMKNFSNAKIIYLGAYIRKQENILEIGLLLKPSNIFNYIPIDISEKNTKLNENNYTISKENENILVKFVIRLTCFDKFILTDKKENQSYIICRDDNKKEIVPKRILLNKILGNEINGKFLYLFNIEGKMFLIFEMPNNKDESSNLNYIYFGICQVISDKDKYNLELIQQIKIKSEGEKNINIHFPNMISISFKNSITFINIDKNGSVDNIGRLQFSLGDVNISRYFYDKSNEINIFLFIVDDNKIFLSKITDVFEKLGKCKKEYLKNDEDKDENKKENIIIEVNNNTGIAHIKEQRKDKKDKKDKKEKKEKKKKTKIDDDNLAENMVEEDESENNVKDYINRIIKETIEGRMEYNMRKIEEMKNENDRKLKLIKDDIDSQNKDIEILEQNINQILLRIKKINEMKNNYNDDEEEEEEEKEVNNSKKKYEKNSHHHSHNRNFINKQNYQNIQNNQKNNIMKINQMNQINQMNNIRQITQAQPQQLINQLNIPNQNVLLINNNSLNEQKFLQFIQQQQQQRNIINQGNYYFPNNYNNNYK